MAKKNSKLTKWKVGSASILAVAFLFNYTKSTNAFQQAHQVALVTKNKFKYNQSTNQNPIHGEEHHHHNRYGERRGDDSGLSSFGDDGGSQNQWNQNNNGSNNSQSFTYSQRQTHTRTNRS